MASTAADAATPDAPDLSHTDAYKKQVGSRYSWYVLGLLVVIYMVNFIDRQIISILAEDIKKDLGVSDSELGFLYGTAFAIFYALFGIPLGRLADMWVRTRLMSLGLALWSGMTALSGFASGFAQLASARVGVGIGEASASPCAYSLLSDYFPKHMRATVLAIYSGGLYLGGGLSLFLGGFIVDKWTAAYPDKSLAPFGLAGWQAAFVGVGLPGLVLALLVATLREPTRGIADGLVVPPTENIGRKFWLELTAILPPLTLFHLAGIGGAAAVIRNLIVIAGVAASATVLTLLIGDAKQWIGLGIGIYAVASWSQSLKFRDAPTHKLIFGTPAFLYAVAGFGLISFAGYSVGFWSTPYVVREFGISKPVAGFIMGGGGALGGFLGVVLGGFLADKLKKRGPSGRLYIAFAACLLPVPFAWVMFTTHNVQSVYILNFVISVLGSLWVGVGAATTQDMVLPRMRGTAGATYFIGTTMIGLSLGPYYTGAVSKITGSLATGVLALYLVLPITLFCLWQVRRLLPDAESTRVARAQAAGEIL